MVVFLPPQTVSGTYSYVLTREVPVKVALYNTGTGPATVTFFQYRSDTVTESVLANSTQIRDLSDLHTVSGNATGTTLILEVVSGDEDLDPRYIGGTVTPVGSALSLDSYVIGQADASVIQLTLTTSKPNDVILVALTYGNSPNSVTSIGDVAGLSWTQRATVAGPGTAHYTDLWWAPSSATLTGDVITVNFKSTSVISAVAFSVAGSTAYTSPFDGGLPVTNTGTSNAPTSASFTTASQNDFVIAIMGASGSPTVTEPASYTRIGAEAGPVCDVSYDVVSGFDTGTTLTWGLGSSVAWETIVDAVAG